MDASSASRMEMESAGTLPRWARRVGVVAFAALSLLVFFSVRSGRWLPFVPASPTEEALDPATHTVFIRTPGSYLEIPDHPSLMPQSGKDFLVAVWVKLRDLPDPKERSLFLIKYDEEKKTRPGYGLAFSREKGMLRPEVYWRNEEGKGGWHLFPELPLPAKEWCLVALSFRKGRYLGLHARIGKGNEAGETRLLGGYDLGETPLPRSDAPLLVGSPGWSSFQGTLGPVLVAHPKNLSRRLPELLESMGESLFQLPRVEPKEVGLLVAAGMEDEGPFHHSAIPVRLRR